MLSVGENSDGSSGATSRQGLVGAQDVVDAGSARPIWGFAQGNNPQADRGDVHSPCWRPYSGNMNLGQLGNVLTNGEDYRPFEVQTTMEQLWAEYVDANPRLFEVHD
jgi:hypothetical protein